MQNRELQQQNVQLEGLVQEQEAAAMELQLRADILQARVADFECSMPSNAQLSEQVPSLCGRPIPCAQHHTGRVSACQALPVKRLLFEEA